MSVESNDAKLSETANVLSTSIDDFTVEQQGKDLNCITHMWIDANICGEIIPVMIDTGATPSCIALRCVSQ